MSRITFVAPRSLLDRRSGAAVSLQSTLEALAAAGHDARAVTATLFFGDTEYPLARVAGPEAERPEYVGRRIRVHANGVTHDLFRTRSTVDANLGQDEADTFGAFVAELLGEAPPDLIITFGADAVARGIHEQLRRLVPRLVFYLATEHHDDAAHLRLFDRVIVPSGFMRERVATGLGVEAVVLPSIINRESYAGPDATLAGTAPDARRFGVVTMVNPSPEKGGTLFLRLLDLAAREAPAITFLGIEVRHTLAQWRAAGVDLADQPNLWWLPNQRDLRRVYARTAALLVPSFWEEASARVIAEAQLGGIPVLASDHAGIPEQLNGGGFRFTIPERCRRHHAAVPSEAEVRPWLDTLRGLFDDPDFYRESSARALEAAAPWEPANARERVRELFEGILATPPAGAGPGAEHSA